MTSLFLSSGAISWSTGNHDRRLHAEQKNIRVLRDLDDCPL